MIKLSAPGHIKKAYIRLSGSKSISNRILILNEVFGQGISFQNLSDSEDTKLLQKAILQIHNKKEFIIDVHHAGTDMRFLTALLSVTEGEWTLTGSERMKQRPIGDLVTALRDLGSEIAYLEKENYPPLKITGKNLQGGKIEMNSSISSQFISALLLIAPKLEQGLQIRLKGSTVSRPYIDMTLALLKSCGINFTETGDLINVSPFHKNTAPSFRVESDWSSASYWYSICALSGHAEIELQFLNEKSLQADSVLPGLYKQLGVNTIFKKDSVLLASAKGSLNEFDHDFTSCPDIAQTIAVTCFGLGIKASLRGLSTLKVKETDRILALKNELEKFGADLVISENSITLAASEKNKKKTGDPGAPLIHTYNDHRMAMSFAPLALLYSTIHIDEPSVVAKSYPAFWEDLKSVGFNVNLHA